MKIKSKRRQPKKANYLLKDLPKDYPWKILGWVTGDLRQYLTESEYSQIVSITRHRDIESYLALSEEWVTQSIKPTDDTLAAMQARYQLTALLKKFLFATESSLRRQKAIDKFIEAESACRDYNLEGYKDFCFGTNDFAINVFTYAKSFLRKLLGDSLPSTSIMTEWSRHGPGATIDTEKGCVSLYHKFSEWPYSCTIGALRYARFLIETDRRWLGALEDDYRRRNNIPKHVILNQDLFWSSIFRVVDGNRIEFVPKSAQIDRSIAIEPSLNLYLQLGVDGFIRRRLKRWGVDIDSQSKNQEMARIGSFDKDDTFVTLDMKSASDMISIKLCELLLPDDWYNYLIDIRSPTGDIDNDTISYEKISSMGNGYTFALETAIFTAITYAVKKELEGTFDHSTFAIFGDDIIVTKSIAKPLISALRLAGFTINSEKSFFEGSFRESCGADWFQGIPVRPVFLKSQPKSVMELFNDINRLNRFFALRFPEIEEPKSINRMKRWIPERFRAIIGPYSDEDFDSYIHSPVPKGKFASNRNCMWRYKRLVVVPIARSGTRFLFRKLMHNLKPTPPIPTWSKQKGKGSRFTVHKRNLVTVSKTYSVSDIWRSMYRELRPR